MENLIVFQIGILLFAVASAFEEAAFTFPFRVLNENQFPFSDKKGLLKTAHRAGGFGVSIILLSIGVVQYRDTESIIAGLLASGACGFVYWLTFDPVFALTIDQAWHYLGNTAGSDKGLGKLLGKNAGQIKAAFCVVVIIAINLVYKIFI